MAKGRTGKGNGKKRAGGAPPRPVEPPEWPASRPELWPIEKIVPYPRNPRVHPDEEIEQLAADMRSDGVTMPILVDEAGTIIAGHGRLLAAQKNGFLRYPVAVARGWTDEQKRSARIRDNQRTLQGSWDANLLRLEFSELKLEGYDLSLLGFHEATLEWMTTGDLVLDPATEWGGMPAFQQGDKTAFRTLVVHFKDQAAVDTFAELVKQKITPKTRFLWYPEVEIETYVDKRYAAE